jgi:hypothetical protein
MDDESGPDGSQLGVPVFSGENLTAPAAQEAVLAACDKISALASVQPGRGGRTKPETVCFMRDFKDYRRDLGLPFPVPAGELVPALYRWRFNRTCTADVTASCFYTADGKVDSRPLPAPP